MATIDRREGRRGVVTWRVRWRDGGTRAGKVSYETCDTEKVAKKFRALVEAAGEHRPEGYPKGCRGRQLAPAEPRPKVSTAPTFEQVMEERLALRALKTDPRAVPDNRRLYRNHVAETIVTLPSRRQVGPLGRLPITAFTAAVGQAWVLWMRGRTWRHCCMAQPSECTEHTRSPQPYSPKSIKNIYECVIGATIRFAVKRGYISANQYIFDDVVLPAYRGTTVRLDQIPVGNEIGAWIDCGYEVSELAGDIVLLALGTGMRWGEIAGLAPFEHDYENSLLTVAWIVKEDANRKFYIDDLRGKSDHAIRTFRLPSRVNEMRHRRSQGLAPDTLDLRGADLRDADLRETKLDLTDLRAARLQGADLRDASLRGADLRNVKSLGSANLQGTDLRHVHLSAISLSGDLSGLSATYLTDKDMHKPGGWAQLRGYGIPATVIKLDPWPGNHSDASWWMEQ